MKNYPMKSYSEWRSDKHHHWIDAGHTFGVHLMQQARDEALENIPENASAETRAVATMAVHDALGGVMQMLDGFYRNEIGNQHKVEYALLARIINQEGTKVEEIELAPDGDGLCMGFAGWWEDEFW